jgi:predicted O-methyltransferase YrrM
MKRGNALLHCVRFVAGLEAGETQTTEQERRAISTFAKNATRAAEIGVFEGVTTAVIAEAMSSEGVLYGIDPFFTGRLGISYGKIIATTALRRRGLRHKVRLLEGLSFDMAGTVSEELDFVFIDGDHRFEALARDWADWSSKLRLGGTIALHDTQAPSHDPGVAEYGSARFFREQIVHDQRFERVASVDSLNVLRRVKH